MCKEVVADQALKLTPQTCHVSFQKKHCSFVSLFKQVPVQLCYFLRNQKSFFSYLLHMSKSTHLVLKDENSSMSTATWSSFLHV